ncbi:MAG: TPR repeat protein [Gammaproteobacteria bacterium]|jgi:TPR repeat protein
MYSWAIWRSIAPLTRLSTHPLTTASLVFTLLLTLGLSGSAVAATFADAQRAYKEANASKDSKHPGYATAHEIWSTLAAEGDNPSIYHLGVFHLYGLGGAEFDQIQGFKLIRQAAEAGYPKAQAYVGLMYENGQGMFTTRDVGLAAKWYEKASQSGHCYSVRRMAKALENGELTLSADPDAAKDLLTRYARCFETKAKPAS